VLTVPAREIPVPTSVSPEAQSVLARGVRGTEYPRPDDLNGWRKMIAAGDQTVLEMIGHTRPREVDVQRSRS
jgi:epsilon-lactone hydrolase